MNNTKLTVSPVCPHCSHAETDAWEWDFGPGLEGEHTGNCNSCGDEFKTYREVSVYYSTSKITPALMVPEPALAAPDGVIAGTTEWTKEGIPLPAPPAEAQES